MKNVILLLAVFFTRIAVAQENASLTDFDATQKGNTVQLSWNALHETNLNSHEIQKSANGTSFSNIGTVAAQNNGATLNYTFLDATPVESNNYYRLRTTDKMGNVTFSNIIRVNNSARRTDVRVLANPVQGGILNLQLLNLNNGKYIISLYSNSGQKVFARSLDLTEGSTTETINLPKNIGGGMYFLQLTDGEMRINKQVMVQ